jgi:polysaccharide deacetylase family protein (PEP-CTERM system associated)
MSGRIGPQSAKRAAAAGQTTAVLTIDFEEWEAVVRQRIGDRPPGLRPRFLQQTYALLDLLDELQATATFFTLGMTAAKYPQAIEAVAAHGHEIASHGYGHARLDTLTEREFRSDLERSLRLLERLSGARPRGYRAPWFSINRDSLWALGVLADAGLEYDSSQLDSPLARRRFAPIPLCSYRLRLPDGRGLVEFPVSVWPLLGWRLPIGGGGYWRLLPARVVQMGLRYAARRSGHLTLYFHPFEYDRQRLRASHPHAGDGSAFHRRLWYAYYEFGRRTIAAKLRHASASYRFVSVAQFLDAPERAKPEWRELTPAGALVTRGRRHSVPKVF